ncbi:MAG: 2-dehydropantoate 2-reductase [Spirochaetes bacterium]|nr:2-dehydropantoate 2-reductase [Spirochaetota bacterium]
MNISIVGPGAIGLLMAGYLQRSGARVTLVDNIPDRAALLEREGFRWEGLDADVRVSVPVTLGLREPGKTDLVMICVKAYHTDGAAREIAAAGYGGPVLTLQNGVGNAEIIGRNVPDAQVIAGITSEGANLASLNHVRHAGRGKTSFGPLEYGRPGDEFLGSLVALMRDGGIDAELSGDPQSLIWSKVVVNAGINALTAILNVRNGMLLEIGHARSLMADLVREGCEVVRRKGYRYQCEDPVAHVEEVCRLTADNISSMCQDIRNGRPTEIDFINGAIVRECEILNIPCPCNSAVTRIIHAIESLGAPE